MSSQLFVCFMCIVTFKVVKCTYHLKRSLKPTPALSIIPILLLGYSVVVVVQWLVTEMDKVKSFYLVFS